MPPILRPATIDDAPEIGRIIHDAFRFIADVHRFAPDFPDIAFARRVAGLLLAHPGIHGVVAEDGGRVLGTCFIDQRDEIGGIGPIAVDPGTQSKGIGRTLMAHVMDRARAARGLRLAQDAFNPASASLYAALGFDFRDPLLLVSGRAQGAPPPGIAVRRATPADIGAASALHRRAHGIDRRGEIGDCFAHMPGFVAERGGRLVAYCAAAEAWPANHGVAETEDDMKALIQGASAACENPFAMLLPARQTGLYRWCLGQGFRTGKPMTLMSTGFYQPPAPPLAWFPSVVY